MSNLSSAQFGSSDEPMFHVDHAQPWEQTHEQFLNRPDVFVHGRYVGRDVPLNQKPAVGFDLHAGTRGAALDRIRQVGVPFRGSEQHARFFAGQVDPSRMQNQPPAEGPHHHPDQVVVRRALGSHGQEIADVVHPASNEWRHDDQNVDWGEEHLNSYYRNDAEDVGSTSVILGGHDNFRTWRGQVSAALRDGKPVPTHVRALHEASGGEKGSVAYFDSEHEADKVTHRQPTHDEPMFPVSHRLFKSAWG